MKMPGIKNNNDLPIITHSSIICPKDVYLGFPSDHQSILNSVCPQFYLNFLIGKIGNLQKYHNKFGNKKSKLSMNPFAYYEMNPFSYSYMNTIMQFNYFPTFENNCQSIFGSYGLYQSQNDQIPQAKIENNGHEHISGDENIKTDGEMNQIKVQDVMEKKEGNENKKDGQEMVSAFKIERMEQKREQTEQEEQVQMGRRRSETKNLIKNYGRAMLSFICKKSQLRRKVMKKLGISDGLFLESVNEFKTEIHTISAIRYIWSSHPYSKAFRILCCEFLRKYNFKHTFNSRVVKFELYLKYRSKMMKSMENPHQFESIKDFY